VSKLFIYVFIYLGVSHGHGKVTAQMIAIISRSRSFGGRSRCGGGAQTEGKQSRYVGVMVVFRRAVMGSEDGAE
jgi:hypothetical protein